MSVVATLGVRPVIDLVGPDSRRFANGMFTNNVRDLAVGSSQRSAMTDDRGRLLGLMELHALADDRFRLVLEGMGPEAFAERYERYVVFDDVEIVFVGEQPLQTVQGADAESVLQQAGLSVPPVGGHVVVDQGLIARRDRGGDGFDLLGLPALEPSDDASARAERLRIAAGHVGFPVDVVKPFLPHEHGLRGAILHFEKGCYLGQESIHRIDVMGKPRRALCGVLLAERPGGDEVRHDGKAVGRVTSWATLADGRALGMAVLKKPAETPGASLTVDGVAAEAVAFPFAPALDA